MDRLVATVRDYAWGDTEFIAHLQRRAPSGHPEAELWMGAHPGAPSVLESSGLRLDDHIATDPSHALGDAAHWGSLPFLAKILAAGQPLSIQTHPDAEQARAGFARESAAGIPIDDPTRTYRDPNHKPELVCALTPFHAKCGFRPVGDTIELFEQLGGSAAEQIITRLRGGGTDEEVLRDVLTWLSSEPATQAAERSNAIAASARAAADGPWATPIAWTEQLHALYPGDRGVTVALLLNHVTLAPGEAMFLEAGVLHAYLEGAAVEVMANSDNVIRGGLTAKHIDVDELASLAITKPSRPKIQRAASSSHSFEVPVPEFSLTRYVVDGEVTADATGPEILIATDGDFTITATDHRVTVPSGQPVWIDAADVQWTARGTGTLFRVSVSAISS